MKKLPVHHPEVQEVQIGGNVFNIFAFPEMNPHILLGWVLSYIGNESGWVKAPSLFQAVQRARCADTIGVSSVRSRGDEAVRVTR